MTGINTGWADPRIRLDSSGNLGIGSSGTVFSTTSANTVRVEAPLKIQIPNGDYIDVAKEILLMRYILQRVVPDYDEIVKQFNAIEDIKGAEQWDR
jgi:hypothetical protein